MKGCVFVLCFVLRVAATNTNNAGDDGEYASNYGNDVCMCSPTLNCPAMDQTLASLISKINDGGRTGNVSGQCVECEEEINTLKTLLEELRENATRQRERQQILEDQLRSMSAMHGDETIKLNRELALVASQIASLMSSRDLLLQNQELARRNIEEFTWSDPRWGADSGVLNSVKFRKKQNITSLKLTWNGDLRTYKGSAGGSVCNRWFFTLNGVECSRPSTIDGVILVDTSLNMHRPSSIEGVCHNVHAGDVQIDFNVGACANGFALGDAATCWNSICRILIEEI